MNAGVTIRRTLKAVELPGGWGLLGVSILVIVVVAILFALSPMIPGQYSMALALMIVPVAFLLLYIFWQNERAWIIAALLGHLMIMVDSTPEKVGIGELGFAAITLAGLAVWFFKEVVIHRRQIVNSGFDLLLLSFMVLATVVSLIATGLHDGDYLQWVKEYAIFADILFYFPLKKFVRGRSDIVLLLIVFAFIAFVNGLVALANYRANLVEAVFEWQVSGNRSNLNEWVSMALMLLSAAVFATSRTLRLKMLALVGIASGGAFLVLSLSRAPIVAGVMGIILIMALIPIRQSRNLLLALVISFALAVSVGYLLFPKYIEIISTGLSKRILSVQQVGSDLSYYARVREYGALLERYIPRSPILGNGLGVSFTYQEPILFATSTSFFVHNGYIGWIFKFGYPLALMMFGVMIYPILRTFMSFPRRHAGFMRTLSAGSLACLLSSMVVHWTSNQFTSPASILNMVLCWVFLDFVTRTPAGSLSPETVMIPGTTRSGDERA